MATALATRGRHDGRLPRLTGQRNYWRRVAGAVRIEKRGGALDLIRDYRRLLTGRHTMGNKRSKTDLDSPAERAPWLDALADRFSLTRSRLRAQISRRLHPEVQARVDSSDVIQESFVEAANRQNDASVDSPHIDAWLRFLALQKLAQTHRIHLGVQARDCRRETRLDLANNDSAGVGLCALAADDTSPSEAVLRLEAHHQLDTAMAQLGDHEREILRLRIWEGATNAEAADRLGIEPSAASKRFVRALQRLKRHFQAIAHP